MQVPKETLDEDTSTYDPNLPRAPSELKRKKSTALNITMLLLGPAESGKSTLFKQMKILNLDGFSARERLSFIAPIRRNLMVIFLTILNEMEELKIEFKEEVNHSKIVRFIPVTTGQKYVRNCKAK